MNNFPFYRQNTFYFSIPLRLFLVIGYYDNAFLYNHIQDFVWTKISLLSVRYLFVKMLGDVVILCLIFLETARLTF